MKRLLLLVFAIIILVSSCSKPEKNKLRSKVSESDIFKSTMVESRFYPINANEDNVINSKKGITIVIPKGSIIDKKGKPVLDSVWIELAEASEIDELLLSNLLYHDSTNSELTNLAFFFQATKNGKQLYIDENNPIYLELPSEQEVSLYKGIRNEKGVMNWGKFIKHVEYLIPVPLQLLDFYPSGFENQVEKGLPFRNHEITSSTLLDSLYYSFASDFNGSMGYKISGSYEERWIGSQLVETKEEIIENSYLDTTAVMINGINPASIKAIRDDKFKNTLISTREFEQRLKTIFESCNNDVLEVYVKNINMNLWELDSMAADLLGKDHKLHSKFKEFASYKQTTVKISDKKAELLAKYYDQRKSKIQREIEALRKEMIKKKKHKQEILKKKRMEYAKLLTKRHEYRMKKFGFELKTFGWYNATHKVTLKQLKKFKLNITVENGKQYDRVYSYSVNEEIKSIFSHLSSDKENFNIVYSEDPDLLLKDGQKFTVLAIGYLEDQIGYHAINTYHDSVINVNMLLDSIGVGDLKIKLKKYNRGYNRENKIAVDIEYQAFFYKERKRKRKESEEFMFIHRLRPKVYPCVDWSWNQDMYTVEDYMRLR